MLSVVRIQQKEYLILCTLRRGVAITCRPHTHAACKVLHLLYRKDMAHTLQPRFCKLDYIPVSVQCLNSTQDNTILMMVFEGSDVGM